MSSELKTQESDFRYAMTRDKSVVALVEEQEQRKDEWRRQCAKFDRAHHVRLGIMRCSCSDLIAYGVSADDGLGDLPGEWEEPDGDGYRKPRASNTEARRMLAPLLFHGVQLPGIPMMTLESHADGSAAWCGTSIVLLPGEVWAGLGASAQPDPAIWQPVAEWQYMQAADREDAGETNE